MPPFVALVGGRLAFGGQYYRGMFTDSTRFGKELSAGYKSGLVSIKSMLDAWPDYIGIQIEVPCLQLNFILQLIQHVGLNKYRDFVPKNGSKAATETNSKVIC